MYGALLKAVEYLVFYRLIWFSCLLELHIILGQAGAVRLGISRALTLLEPSLKSILKKRKS